MVNIVEWAIAGGLHNFPPRSRPVRRTAYDKLVARRAHERDTRRDVISAASVPGFLLICIIMRQLPRDRGRYIRRVYDD